MNKNVTVGIIGAGDGANFLLEMLPENPQIKIAGLAYRTKDRPAVKRAEELGVKLFADFRELAELPEVEIIIDASGSQEVEEYLARKKSSSQLLTPLGTWLLWRLVEELKRKERETAQSLAEQQVLYSAGVMLASAANTKQTLDMIMESALSITGMAAGTLALYEEERGVMEIKASLGFKQIRLPETYEWKVRPGGLTGHILSNSRPTVIPDLLKVHDFDTGPLVEMGVRSLIATPLKVSGKIVGILYVDDFRAREFSDREVNILSLLALQAAAAIDKALLLEKAEYMATTDGLTKLYNHRYFVRALEKEVRRADRYGAAVSLCMLDVDHFKKFNDTYGHLQGNVVLTTLSKILRHSARETDIVARYGGEEFAVILTETDPVQARLVADRIRQEVEEAYFPGEEKQPGGKLTVSVGVGTYPTDARDPMELIEKADRALYHSKERGRNAVTSFEDIAKEQADKKK